MTRPLILIVLTIIIRVTITTAVSDDDDDVYLKLVVQASCQVRCLHRSGPRELQLPALDDENELFTKSVACLGTSCQTCWEVEPCRHPRTQECCDVQTIPEESLDPTRNDDPEVTPRPIFHCSKFFPGNNSFEAYFRIELSPGHNSTLANLTERASGGDLPLMFVIETDVEEGIKGWRKLHQFVTSSWFPSVNVPPDVAFRLRVTPVAANRVYATANSEPITIHANDQRGVDRPPRSAHVRRVRQNPLVSSHPDLQVLLHWESGMGHQATCAGRVWALDHVADIHDYSEAKQSFWFNWTNETAGYCLSFDKNYSIQITEASDHRHDYSDATEIFFRLPPCLQFFDNNFTMCAPPPPRNLKFTVNPNNDMVVSWLPPTEMSQTNQIDFYELRLIKFNPHYTTKGASLPGTAMHPPTHLANVTVAGTTYSVLFKNVSNSGLVQVIMRAFSKGGISPMIVEGPHPPIHFQDSVADKFLIAGLVLIFLTVFVAVGLVLKIQKAKRERRRVRAKYFGDDKELDERPECSYFPTYCSKWLIDTDCLKIGELIGEGYFGQVHAATLYKSQSTRIVAVKTLKDGVNLCEKSKFWEEFQILKNLEPHPNLVKLIGIVKAQQPTLVVEYCDGGDLHSYLRKLRDDKLKRLSRERRRLKWMHSGTVSGEFLRQSAHTPALDRYIGSTTPTVATVRATMNLSVVTNDAYFYTSDPDNGQDGQDSSIDPVEFNLFVSFARQIAIGMEFLATNKIVHRDLAARNILVMNKTKPVLKIADFGLSRDVYEKNWYKKNSDEKIPFKWLALECLLDEVYTTKSDVWSYGVLLWEIVTFGGIPYPGIKNVEIFEFLKNGFRMTQPDGCPTDLYILMRKCWEREAEDRPDFLTLRRLLDTMMERSEGLEYFQLVDGHLHQESNQGSTIEADVKYSVLTPLDPRSDDKDVVCLGADSRENLLYASILDSNSSTSVSDEGISDVEPQFDKKAECELTTDLVSELTTVVPEHRAIMDDGKETDFLVKSTSRNVRIVASGTVRYATLAGAKSGEIPVDFV